MDFIIQNFFNVEIMGQAFLFLMRGFGMTLLLIALVIPVGCLGGLLQSSARRVGAGRWAVIVYVDFFRAFPPLVLLIFIYAGLPFAGIDLPVQASVVSFCIHPLTTERSSGLALKVSARSDRAARSTGLNGLQTMVYVILPQAVRNVLPDLAQHLGSRETDSLASVVAGATYSADMARPSHSTQHPSLWRLGSISSCSGRWLGCHPSLNIGPRTGLRRCFQPFKRRARRPQPSVVPPRLSVRPGSSHRVPTRTHWQPHEIREESRRHIFV